MGPIWGVNETLQMCGKFEGFPPKKIVHEVWVGVPFMTPGIMASGFLVNYLVPMEGREEGKAPNPFISGSLLSKS